MRLNNFYGIEYCSVYHFVANALFLAILGPNCSFSESCDFNLLSLSRVLKLQTKPHRYSYLGLCTGLGLDFPQSS